jgi:hypothetical protein
MGELMRKITDTITFEERIQGYIAELQEMVIENPVLKESSEKIIAGWKEMLAAASPKTRHATYPRIHLDIPMPILPEDK